VLGNLVLICRPGLPVTWSHGCHRLFPVGHGFCECCGVRSKAPDLLGHGGLGPEPFGWEPQPRTLEDLERSGVWHWCQQQNQTRRLLSLDYWRRAALKERELLLPPTSPSISRPPRAAKRFRTRPAMALGILSARGTSKKEIPDCPLAVNHHPMAAFGACALCQIVCICSLGCPQLFPLQMSPV
jgi:hypothetical protein